MRTELHFHLLPGVDDGPRSVQESLELARMAVADGTTTVVCTPHARDVDVATVPDRVAAMRDELRRAGIALRLIAGVEVAQDDVARMSAAELEIAAQGPEGRRWILLEAPLMLDAGGLLEAAAELGARGYGLVIAHPERCPPLMEPGGGLDDLLGAGALLQINGSSLTGRHGGSAYDWALELAAAGRASVIASDAHRPARGPVLSAAVAEVIAAAGIPERAAERLVAGSPHALLQHGLAPATAIGG